MSGQVNKFCFSLPNCYSCDLSLFDLPFSESTNFPPKIPKRVLGLERLEQGQIKPHEANQTRRMRACAGVVFAKVSAASLFAMPSAAG